VGSGFKRVHKRNTVWAKEHTGIGSYKGIDVSKCKDKMVSDNVAILEAEIIALKAPVATLEKQRIC
jgi:hypothetical protein